MVVEILSPMKMYVPILLVKKRSGWNPRNAESGIEFRLKSQTKIGIGTDPKVNRRGAKVVILTGTLRVDSGRTHHTEVGIDEIRGIEGSHPTLDHVAINLSTEIGVLVHPGRVRKKRLEERLYAGSGVSLDMSPASVTRARKVNTKGTKG